jgi:hypothetical protein
LRPLPRCARACIPALLILAAFLPSCGNGDAGTGTSAPDPVDALVGDARRAKRYGAERIIVDSACDWGISEPLGVPKTAKLAAERGVPEAHIRKICYQNALDAYGQSGQMKEEDWLKPEPIDQRNLYEGNSILRGGREPKVEEPKVKRTREDLLIK